MPQVYAAVAKVAISVVGATAKALLLSILMYAYSATGARLDKDIDISAWWNPIGKIMKNRLKNSKKIKDRIKEYIKKIPRGRNSYSKKEGINFLKEFSNNKDLDLGLSVGNATNCVILVEKTKKKKLFSSKYKYNITIELSDKYDFAKFDAKKQGKIITAVNNGLGYYPQSWGVLKIYKWKIKYSFSEYY